MRFSLRLNNDLPVKEYVRLAQLAESVGFDQFWVSHDLFLRSAPVILTAIATTTQRIEIGTCILNPYTMNPAEIAMLAATLDEVSNERFNLGLSSGAGDFLAWIDISQEKPRTAVIETVHAVNRLLSGERVAVDGEFLHWTDEAYLRFASARRVPIYLGAMSPKMLEEIGSIADGGLPLLFPPEHYQTILPYIQTGAKNAGRDLSTIDIAACIWCSIADDQVTAEDGLKEKIAYYGHALSPMILSNLGLTHADFEAIEHAVMVENNLVKAKALVTPEMLRIGISGTTHDLIARLKSLVDLGVQHISFGPPLGPDIAHAVEMIGRDVIPYFTNKK
ncbi:MAG TPA: LLM class flavin-dependent oxidoreductase [Phototrophicaceae bacterium]|nr:LLM class flavin-dependent oxidoreductase [Phototrophicaceae bacterium]